MLKVSVLFETVGSGVRMGTKIVDRRLVGCLLSSSVVFVLFCLVFPLFVILVVPFASSTATFTTRNLAQNETDEVALRAFKLKIFRDAQGVLNSWNDSSHFCEWEGITCGYRRRRVTVLNISSKGLSGSLSPYIGNLSFLKRFVLYNNSIQGEIPHEFGRLRRLKYLILSNNSLVGEIPANLSHCSRLVELYVQGNKLVGKIPSKFDSLYNLEVLSLSRNNLTGQIPSFLGNLTSLKVLAVSYNSFGGNIPHSLGRLKNLTVLRLGVNNFFGTVPHSFYDLSSLEIFCV
ncbi:hypothetical protein Ddye_030666 [Dipteronia dyeriana]|uniref:Leucine-rich repeat-containing N-terminal plant-type domain-containing protein n=1 Tax=Dipteronia dyeriana TaxID=168575 RepID=A0AAD9TGT7_9ROSI|nr:hypothetical protein Ddye_030666 [Dipteronia dyeriana]